MLVEQIKTTNDNLNKGFIPHVRLDNGDGALDKYATEDKQTEISAKIENDIGEKLEEVIVQLKIMNIHLAEMTGSEIEEDDTI